jgi:hypothetical protein
MVGGEDGLDKITVERAPVGTLAWRVVSGAR